jgi:hypothetical protein
MLENVITKPELNRVTNEMNNDQLLFIIVYILLLPGSLKWRVTKPRLIGKGGYKIYPSFIVYHIVFLYNLSD